MATTLAHRTCTDRQKSLCRHSLGPPPGRCTTSLERVENLRKEFDVGIWQVQLGTLLFQVEKPLGTLHHLLTAALADDSQTQADKSYTDTCYGVL